MKRISIAEIRKLSTGYFFDKETLKYFRTILPRHGFENEHTGEIFFTTSDQMEDEMPRLYSIRVMRTKTDRNFGRVYTLNYRKFHSKRDAMLKCQELATNPEGATNVL